MTAQQRGRSLANVDLKYCVGMGVPPVPIILALAIGGTVPVNSGVVLLLPINTPSTLLVFIKVVVILMVFIVDVMTMIVMIITIPIVVTILSERGR